jgi:hypothetical protein
VCARVLTQLIGQVTFQSAAGVQYFVAAFYNGARPVSNAVPRRAFTLDVSTCYTYVCGYARSW